MVKVIDLGVIIEYACHMVQFLQKWWPKLKFMCNIFLLQTGSKFFIHFSQVSFSQNLLPVHVPIDW